MSVTCSTDLFNRLLITFLFKFQTAIKANIFKGYITNKKPIFLHLKGLGSLYVTNKKPIFFHSKVSHTYKVNGPFLYLTGNLYSFETNNCNKKTQQVS